MTFLVERLAELRRHRLDLDRAVRALDDLEPIRRFASEVIERERTTGA